MLRFLSFSLVLLQAVAKPVPPATHVPAADIEAAFKDARAQNRTDIPIQTMDAGTHNVEVAIANVVKPTGFVAHDKVTEMYYVLEGLGTHVSGGVLVNPRRSGRPDSKVVGPTGPSMSGDSIRDGTARRIGKGDYVILPAGTPHAWTEVTQPLRYIDVRIDPERVLQPLGKRRIQ